MAFKINTQMQPMRYTPPAKKQPQVEETEQKPEPQKATQSKGYPKTQINKVYPSQNLLDKYKSPGSFHNTQSSLGGQVGIPNISTQTNSGQSDGDNLLLEYLQGQNSALNGLDDKSKMLLDYQKSQDLESQIKNSLGQNHDDDFLSELLRKIQSSGI